MTTVFITDTKKGINEAVEDMFSNLEKEEPIPYTSKDIYIKVNGIDHKAHVYTTPEFLEAVIKYLQLKGGKVHVMEDASQNTMTRLVFAINGYKEICDRTGVEVHYLDEEATKTFEFKGKPSIKDDPNGYILKKFRMSTTIVKIMENRDDYIYINLPKLKTHSMGRVTLGMKNQWGYPLHEDRGKDHNFNLHSKIVDVYEYIRPDITIIDGIEGTIHGHYPVTAWADRLVKRFDILIGGRDTLAVDVVGARIFGLTLDEVPHLKIANERGLGEGLLSKINVVGKNLDDYKEKYEWNLLDEYPDDVKIVKGKERVCKEGCQNNTLSVLQMLAYDYPEKFKGGYFIVMGKGHDENLIDQLKEEGYKKGLVVGHCAIEEVGEKMSEVFSKRRLHFSGNCNNLEDTVLALLKLSRMNVFDLTPISEEELSEIGETVVNAKAAAMKDEL
ncbi:MAG: DUF362 domain-containing protein [archaeon]|nr:DUF362 domain-containing protein [archaeon]